MSQHKITVYVLCGTTEDRSANAARLQAKLALEPVEVLFLYPEPGHTGKARYDALQQIDTEWVCYLDDDDDFVAGAFTKILAAIETNPSESIFCPMEYIVYPGERVTRYSTIPPGTKYFPPTAHRLMHHIFPMRTSVAKEYAGVMLNFPINAEIAFKAMLSLSGYKVKIIPEYLYYWIKNPNGTTADRGPLFSVITLLKAVRTIFVRQNEDEFVVKSSTSFFESYVAANPGVIPDDYYS